MNDSNPAKTAAWRARISKYREEILKAALVGLPLFLISWLNDRLGSIVLNQPWQALVILLPLGAAIAVLWNRVARQGRLGLDRPFLVLLGSYVLLFVLAAQTRILDWQRDPELFGQPTRGSWLAPISWGDWRYKIVPKVTGNELVVVLRDATAGQTREAARAEAAVLMGLAQENEAKGVVFDYRFDGVSGVDTLLCAAVDSLTIPVLFGYGFERFQQRLTALPLPETLQSCVTTENLGHLVGFLDVDRKARVMPLFFNNDVERPALGLRAARLLAPANENLLLPYNGLVRFVEPSGGAHIEVDMTDVLQDAAARRSFSGRLVFVGERSEPESFATPFGTKPGVVVHADVAHSLIHQHYISDVPWWASLAVMLLFCYSLATLCADGVPTLRLVALCAGATVMLIGTAIFAIRVGPYWFDVIYPAAAVWCLLPLLLALRSRIGVR